MATTETSVEHKIESHAGVSRRNELMENYFRTRALQQGYNRQVRTVILSEEYPCPKALGKKGKAIWDLTIDSYREEFFKKALLPHLESYVLIALEVQKLRGDVVDNGFFKYKTDRNDEPVMVMRTEAQQFLNLSNRLIMMLGKLNIVNRYDSTQLGDKVDPAKKMAEQEQILVGSQSTRSHLMGRDEPEEEELDYAA